MSTSTKPKPPPPHPTSPPALRGGQIFFFSRIAVYHKSPDSGELQFTPRAWKRRSDPALRAGGAKQVATRLLAGPGLTLPPSGVRAQVRVSVSVRARLGWGFGFQVWGTGVRVSGVGSTSLPVSFGRGMTPRSDQCSEDLISSTLVTSRAGGDSVPDAPYAPPPCPYVALCYQLGGDEKCLCYELLSASQLITNTGVDHACPLVRNQGKASISLTVFPGANEH